MKKSIYLLLLFFSCGSISLRAQDGNTTYGDQAGANITIGDYNTLLGDSTGFTINSQRHNTIIGKSAGLRLRSSDNTIIGAYANYLGQNGFDNVIIGARSGYRNVGNDNTFVGQEAGENNTDGRRNTFLGEESGRYNTSGRENTFVGQQSGRSNTTGRANCFVGNGAGWNNETGNGNTFVGGIALNIVTTDLGNILGSEYDFDHISRGPGFDNRGHGNTFLGSGAGADIGDAHANTMLGFGAGINTEHASGNTFVGYGSGWNNNRNNQTNTAKNNTFLGTLAGGSNWNGSDNVFIGWNADFTGIGNSGGNHQNIVIGASASIGLDNLNNSIAIGYQATVTASNSVSIGNVATGTIGGFVNWTATSDGRFKTDVKENVVGLDFINRLRPVTYHYDAEELHNMNGFETSALQKALAEKSQIRYSGFIAQEVESSAKEIGYDFSGVDAPKTNEDIYGLRYAEFTVPMVKAIQELHEKVEAQEVLILQQQEQLEAFQNLFTRLESKLENLESTAGQRILPQQNIALEHISKR